jgi:hypothetical protein
MPPKLLIMTISLRPPICWSSRLICALTCSGMTVLLGHCPNFKSVFLRLPLHIVHAQPALSEPCKRILLGCSTTPNNPYNFVKLKSDG